METKIDFKKIKAKLPHGAQTKIAKMAKVTNNTVHLVLNGKSNNVEVINAIADYLESIKEKKAAAFDRLSNLID